MTSRIRKSVRADAADHHSYRANQNDDVEPQGLFAGIYRIEADARLIRHQVAPAYRPQAGDSRTAAVIGSDLVRVTFDLAGYDGTRADETHVASQHIDELRQLIHARAAQEQAEPSDSRIGGELKA